MSGAKLGPQYGVPTAIKDLFDFKPGWRPRLAGVGAFRDFVADFWCVFAKRIEAAGRSSWARRTAR
jgi:amidase